VNIVDIIDVISPDIRLKNGILKNKTCHSLDG